MDTETIISDSGISPHVPSSPQATLPYPFCMTHSFFFDSTRENMPLIVTGTIAIALYICAFILQIARARRLVTTGVTGADGVRDPQQKAVLACVAVALIAHLYTSVGQVFTGRGISFALMPISVAIFFLINTIVAVGSVRQPLDSLYLLLLPATIAVTAISLWSGIETPVIHGLSTGLAAHILMSIVAYSLMTIAALQALFLAYQNRQLHQHRATGLLRLLPPLQTLENLMFALVATGFVLLTFALLIGFAFVEDFLAQHLAHKTVFSLVAWVVYATLLWGRFKKGWRGRTAAAWTLGGFCALMLGFWGSKFVLEVLV